jgi:hypothetical protein
MLGIAQQFFADSVFEIYRIWILKTRQNYAARR